MKHAKNTYLRIREFTLVELLVVIAIVGILAAMLMPALSRSLEAARQIACSSNIKNLHVAWQQYEDDYDNRPVIIAAYASNWYKLFIQVGYVDESNWPNWPNYVAEREADGLYRCPSESRASVGGKTPWNTWKGSHFSMNRQMVNSWTSPANPHSVQQWDLISKIPGPSRISLLGDKNPDSLFIYTYAAGKEFRHSKGWNVLFLDGHLKRKGAYETPQFPPDPNSYKDVFYGDARGPGYGWW